MIPIEIPEKVNLVIHEIAAGNVSRLEAMLELYIELFPTHVRYLPIMRHRAQMPINADPRFVEHQWLIDIDGQAAGMTFFKYVPRRNCGLLIDLAIRPAYRRMNFEPYRRFSEFLILAGLGQLQADAAAMGHSTLMGMGAEVETPKLVTRFSEYGFIELPVEYYEPPFIQGREALADPTELVKADFHPMQLGIFPTAQYDPADPTMLTDLVFAFLVDHYGLPEEHWAVRHALNSVQ